jgi:CBS domain containing-hemolysin-like protein
MLLSTLNDMLELALPHRETHTIGGLVMETLGRVPEVGDRVEVGHIKLRVEAVAHNSVAAVCIALPPEAGDLPAGEDVP